MSRIVARPNGVEYDLEFARWPDGTSARRWIGSSTAFHDSSGNVCLCGPESQRYCWLFLEEERPPMANYYGVNNGPTDMERIQKFAELVHSSPSGHDPKVLVGALVRDYLNRYPANTRWMIQGRVDENLASPPDLIQLDEDLLMFAMLGEIHPVWKPEREFREWLRSSFPALPAQKSR